MTESRLLHEMAKTILALDRRIRALEKAAPKQPQVRHVSVVGGEYAGMVEIVGMVAKARGISVVGLMGRNHGPMYAHPRHEAMTLCHEAGYSKVAIGEFFDRDTSTILDAIKAHRARAADK